MQNNDCEHIQKLMDLFFEGKTTNAEEKELYEYFTQRLVIPKQFEPYREMFRFFESGMAEAVAPSDVPVKKQKRVSLRKIGRTALVIAASLLILFMVGSRIYRSEEDVNPYQGSYMVKNGVRYPIGEAEARAIEQQALRNEQMAFMVEKEALRQMQEAQNSGRLQTPAQTPEGKE